MAAILRGNIHWADLNPVIGSEQGGFPGGILPTVESKAAHLSHFVVKNHIPGVPTAVMRPTTPCKRECILSQWKI